MSAELAPNPTPTPTQVPPSPPSVPAAAPTRHSGAVAGWILVVLGLLFLAGNVVPDISSWIAPLMFGTAGIAFLAWYGVRPQHRWAILAGGSLLSLAAVIGWSDFFNIGGGSVLFVGWAATFAAYAIAPPTAAHHSWAYWVAGGCLLIAVLATGFTWAWPLVLIAIGAWLLLRRGLGSTA